MSPGLWERHMGRGLESKRQEGGEERRCGMHGDRHAW